MFKARFRIDRSRAFSFPALVAAVAAAGIAQGQTQDCDELPEADRQLCRMMRACAVIDDAERRRECFRAVVEAAPDTSSDEVVGEPSQPGQSSELEPSTTAATSGEPKAASETSDQAVPTVSTVTVERPIPESTSAVTTPPVGERTDRKRTWGSRIRSLPVVGRLVPGARKDRQPTDAPVSSTDAGIPALGKGGDETVGTTTTSGTVVGSSTTYEVLDIPKRFTATVSAIHDPGGNRRLVALDQRLLFVSDRGGEGRLKVGDDVRVQKTSGLFGRKYRITGPSRRPFTALRIRCERPDLNEANQQRCLLLSR
ncbi:MAG: hypothetical protein OXH09_21870 [Gammaproteobacteria bacterium]|nr:hypothetical protein [Gammaproteobacteria bacterium]